MVSASLLNVAVLDVDLDELCTRLCCCYNVALILRDESAAPSLSTIVELRGERATIFCPRVSSPAVNSLVTFLVYLDYIFQHHKS